MTTIKTTAIAQIPVSGNVHIDLAMDVSEPGCSLTIVKDVPYNRAQSSKVTVSCTLRQLQELAANINAFLHDVKAFQKTAQKTSQKD